MIANDRLDSALKALQEQAIVQDPEVASQLILLRGQYVRYKKSKIENDKSNETMNIEINSITNRLLEVVRMNESLFLNGNPEEIRRWKSELPNVVETAERKILSISKSLEKDKDYGEKQYLLEWWKANMLSITDEVSARTFDILEAENKDEFEFSSNLKFALRFAIKSYLNDSLEWLKEPGFIFNFKEFTKAEARLGIALLSQRVGISKEIQDDDKAGILECFLKLDQGIKDN